MKNSLFRTGLFVFGAALTMVGCGGSMQEEGEGAPTNGSVEADNQTSAIVPEQSSQESEGVNSVSGEVHGAASYCYTHCKDPSYLDPFGHFEKGPFIGVKYANCASHGRKYCESRGYRWEGVSWR